MMKRFKYYESTESQFITPQIQASLDQLRSPVIQGLIGLIKANPDAPMKYILWLWASDPQNNEATAYELAAGIYSHKFRLAVKLAVDDLRRLIHDVNHWDANKSVRIRSINGQYQSIQDIDSYQPTAALLDREARGCTNTRREDEAVIQITAKERRKENARLKQIMDMQIASTRPSTPPPTQTTRKKTKRS
jgi:hypothetical protein